MCKYCDHVLKNDCYESLSKVNIVTKAVNEHKRNGTLSNDFVCMDVGLTGTINDPNNPPSLCCSLYSGDFGDLIDDPVPIRFCPMCGAPLSIRAEEGDFWAPYIKYVRELERKNKALKERIEFSEQEPKEENDRCCCDYDGFLPMLVRNKVLKEMKESFKYESKEDKKSEELLKETEKFYERLDKAFTEKAFFGKENNKEESK